jgi:hypothetical protein
MWRITQSWVHASNQPIQVVVIADMSTLCILDTSLCLRDHHLDRQSKEHILS